MSVRPARFVYQSSLLAMAVVLVGCGQATSDADIAAQQQAALAATVATAPSPMPQNDTILNLAATSAAMTATVAQAATSMPSATTIAATSAATATPNTVSTAAQVAATAPANPSAIPATATSVPVNTATIETAASPTVAPTASEALPTTAPTTIPTAAPTAAPAVATIPMPTTPPTIVPVANNSVTTLTFTELYSGASIEGPILSEKAASLNGSTIVMVGYMAPPLKPDLDFFVLTKDPMVYCPFCSTATDWPFDIVFVRMSGGAMAPNAPTQGIRVVGRFATGTATDAATGFVSQVRIIADRVEVIQ